MSETYPRIDPSPHDVGATSGSGGVGERVRDVTSQTQEAGMNLAHEATEKAGDVVHEAASQAQHLADQARQELSAQAQTQQRKAVEGIRSVSAEFDTMADSSREPGLARDLVRSAAELTNQMAGWLDGRDPRSVLAELQDFARRRPGTFLAIAAGAGLLLGRLGRGARDAATDPGSSGGSPGRETSEGIAPEGPGANSAPSYANAAGSGYPEVPLGPAPEGSDAGGGRHVEHP